MSKKPTDKSVHIDRVQDQDILDELTAQLEGTGIVKPTRRNAEEKTSASEPGKRTARPFSEVSGADEAGKNRVRKPAETETNDITEIPETEPALRSRSVEPEIPTSKKTGTKARVDEKFDTKGLDEVLEFIDTDSYKSSRMGRRARKNDFWDDEDDFDFEIVERETPKASRKDRSAFQQSLEEELENTRNRKKKSRFLIPLILILALAFFTVSYYLFMREISVLFLGPVIVFAVLTVLFILLSNARRKGRRIVGRILSIILAIIMIIGGCGLTYLNIKLARTMGQNADSTQMVVIVRLDDPAQTLEDAKTYTFGYEEKTQPTSMQETIADIESHIGPFVREKYDSTSEECEDLIDGEIDAVIMNAVFIESMDEIIDDFSEQVRVIYTHTVDQAYLDMPPVKDGQSFNVLISGIDTYGEIEAVSRSDVNQIMTVNPEKKQILLTSTPRDYYVPIPDISGGERDKLTHAGIYGIQATANTLGELYDTDINYYVRINFTSLIEVVDTLGGIDVNSEVAFSAGGYDFAEGENHLNGEQALAFSRARHQFEEGDNQRGKNQQYVITAILKKMMSREALSDPIGLFNSLSGFVQTNMTQGEFVRLAADVLASGETYSIERTQATGTGGSDVTYSMPGRELYVMYPDEESVATITKRIKAFLGEK